MRRPCRAVPVKKAPKTFPKTPEWEWYWEGQEIYLAADLGEVPEVIRGRVRLRVYRFAPRSKRPGHPGRNTYFCGEALSVGALDLAVVDRQAEMAWFAKAFGAELRHLADLFGAEPTLCWGCLGWMT